MKKELGQAIKNLRIAKGLTQQQVADAIGVRTPNVSRYEAGAHAPEMERLVVLAKVLGVSASELLRTAEQGDSEHTAAPKKTPNTSEDLDSLLAASAKLDELQLRDLSALLGMLVVSRRSTTKQDILELLGHREKEGETSHIYKNERKKLVQNG
jgi:transcriptional regulator with XRE-family HTH domain